MVNPIEAEIAPLVVPATPADAPRRGRGRSRRYPAVLNPIQASIAPAIPPVIDSPIEPAMALEQ